MANIHMSYMGNFVMNGYVYLCSDMSAVPETSPKFFDHIVGLRDVNFWDKKGPAGSADEDKVGGKAQIQKKFWRYTPVTYKVTASGPISDKLAWALLNPAISGKSNTIGCVFWKDGQYRALYDAVITSCSISARAGDVATFTIEAVGKKMVRGNHQTVAAYCTKLLTWDEIEFELIGAADEASSDTPATNISDFSINVNNPIIPIYTAGSLKPYDIRVGVQEVTGSVSIYGFVPDLMSVTGVRFNLGYGNYKLGTVFAPTQAKAGVGPFITTTTFNGTDDGPVWKDVAGTYP